MKHLFILITFSLLASSCALLKTRDCATADWEKLGRYDANRGTPRDYYDTRKNYCSQNPPAESAASWKKGYDQKIALYCQKSRFFYLGKMDEAAYEANCPESRRQELKTAHTKGHDVYDLSLQRSQIKMRMLSEPTDSERHKEFSAQADDVDHKIAMILSDEKIYSDTVKK